MCSEIFSLNFEVDLNDDPGTFGGATTKRKCTDLFGLIIMVIIFGTAIALTIYCTNNSEIEKIKNGYDDCGNICGKNNLKTDSIPFDCFGKNFEKQKYLLINDVNKTCVEVCPKYIGHNCVVDKGPIPFYPKFFEFYWREIVLLWFFNNFLCIQFYLMDKTERIYFRTDFALFGVILMAATILLWTYIRRLIPLKYDYGYYTISSIAAILIAVVAVVMIPSFYINFKKIDTTLQLIKEVAEATDFMACWTLAFLSNLVVAAYIYGLIFCFFYLKSSSYLSQINEGSSNHPIIEYIPYPIATTTQVLLIYLVFLLYEFMKNLQTLIISGWVAQWYFTKKDNAVCNCAITPLLKHFGTICRGSLFLSITFPIRIVVNALKAAAILSNKCSWPLSSETIFVKYFGFFTRNGVIMTAIHGSSFCAGTIRAQKLLYHNVFNAAAICTFGDLLLIISKIFSWIGAMTLCIILSGIRYFDDTKVEIVYLVFWGILAALFIDYYASTIEIIIITLVLCFCEDCLYNNGAPKPYFMSKNFAQFVENANKYVDAQKWNTVADKWNGGPGRLYSNN